MATLSHLLSETALGLRLVQAGPGDPEVTWASTTELLDLSEYLEGGEIVLTTGLALAGDDPHWRDFVAALSRARVAAIGFGVGVNHHRIPPPLLAAASTYRVALVEVPPPVPFIAVSKAVAGLLRSDELRAAQRALRIHDRLLEGAHGTQDVADVLASISQATGRQLAILDADDAMIARTAGFSLDRSPADAARGSDGSRESLGSDGGEISIDTASGTRLVVEGEAALGPEGRAVVAAGAMVLGLELRGERTDGERERARWSRLTRAILHGDLDARGLALLDPDSIAPTSVRAIAVLGPAEDVAAWHRRPRVGLERLVTSGQARGLGASVPARGDSVARGRDESRPEQRSTGTSLAWQLCPADSGSLDRALAMVAAHGLDAVIGRAEPLEHAQLSRHSAMSQLDAISPVAQLYDEPRTPTVIWADRRAPVLETLVASPDRDALIEAVLGPLSSCSTQDDSDIEARDRGDADRATLRETLRAALEHHGQRGPAAAALGIHRNTLRDRLHRIERLTGRSMDRADDRAELWFALRLEGHAAPAGAATSGTATSDAVPSHAATSHAATSRAATSGATTEDAADQRYGAAVSPSGSTGSPFGSSE